MRSSSKSRRAPNPTTSPPRSRIGHSSRRWNRSRCPRWPGTDRPAFSSSSRVKPCASRCLVSFSQPAGANPQPNDSAAAWSNPRSARNSRAFCASPGAAQLLGVELGGELVRGEQPGAGAAVALDARPAALVGQPEPDAVGELLDGLDEPQLLDLHDEVDDAAALAAAEAVAGVVGRPDVERRGLLVVERAEALHRAGPGGAQGDVLADHLVDPVPVAHLRDVGVPDPPCHGGEFTTPGVGAGGARANSSNQSLTVGPLRYRRDMTSTSAAEISPTAHPLLPGASPATIRSYLLHEDQVRFVGAYEAALDEARRALELLPSSRCSRLATSCRAAVGPRPLSPFRASGRRVRDRPAESGRRAVRGDAYEGRDVGERCTRSSRSTASGRCRRTSFQLSQAIRTALEVSPWTVGRPYRGSNPSGIRVASFGDGRALLVFGVSDQERRWLFDLVIL